MSKIQFTHETDRNKFHSPQSISKGAERNTIQLLTKDAVPGAKHYYYLYTNNSGKQFYLSAYPESTLPPWKKIKMKTGEYVAGKQNPEWQPSNKIGVMRSTSGNAQEVYETFQNLKGEFKRIDNAGIDYGGDRNNSNSAAMTALSNATLTSDIAFEDNRGPEFGTFAPGQNDRLVAPKGLEKSDSGKSQSKVEKAQVSSTASQSSKSAVSTDTTSTQQADSSKASDKNVSGGQGNDSTDVSKAIAAIKENADGIKKNYGLDVTTSEGLGKAVMIYWKENNLDPKTLKEQLPNMKGSDVDAALASVTETKTVETTKTKQVEAQRQ
jgi:hypothetical protein